MADRKAKTMQLSGNDYAKVADRLKLFREDWKNSKIETNHGTNEDGSVEFKAWIWKDKADYLDMLKATQNAELARGSADADGSAKGNIGVKVKDFEKLQTIAVGRALANLGYLGSGDIASFEEMEEFDKFKTEQTLQAVEKVIANFELIDDVDELRKAFAMSGFMNDPIVVKAAQVRKDAIVAAALPNPDDDSGEDSTDEAS